MKRLLYIIGLSLSLTVTGYNHAYGTSMGQLYAVLVNGGRNHLTNHERYWNDCTFLYRTLRQTFHIPKRNIIVLMSDGGAPDEDMLQTDGRGFLSSPVDLDGDGQSDVDYPATEEALSDVMHSMSIRLSKNDHLFLYFIDHGGTYDGREYSYIWLWNDKRLNEYSLASLLSMCRVASINILMGQCYSGGFMTDLMNEGRVITTSCSGNEQSWKCPDRPYDEFVYHWTCAVNGADEVGFPVYADTNGDGEVSMQEAFLYAKEHDRVFETPQYTSCPEQLGEQWTFPRAFSGTMGVQEVELTEQKPSEIWTLSGQRRNNTNGHAIYILRKDGKTRKVVR